MKLLCSFRRQPRHSLRPLALLLALAALACSPGSALQASSQSSAPPAPRIVQPGAPGEPSKVLPPSTHPATPQPSEADIRFMQGMVMHHSQAVTMTALIPSHTTNEQIRLLGARISRSQTDEMQFMQRWLHARGQSESMPMPAAMPGMPDMDMAGNPMPSMPGMLTPAQMSALAAAHGTAFDHLFLTGMIQHHNGALTMVGDLFNTTGAGQDADLFDFATDVDNTQRAEIRIMQGILGNTQ